MPLPSDLRDKYLLESIFLVGGKLYAGYQRNGKKYMAHICHVLDDPYVLITTAPCKVDKLSTRIRHPFEYSRLFKNEKFFVVQKIKVVDGQVLGKQRAFGKGRRKPAVWLPILVNNDDEQVLYVKDPEGNFKLVILENDRPWSSLEKALVGTAAGMAVAAAAVGAAFLAIFAAPVVAAGLGIGAGSVAAGSTAAGAVSVGVVSVATLESIGAASMGVASTIIVGGVGATAGTAVSAAGIAGIAVAASKSKPTYNVRGMKHVYLMECGSFRDMEDVKTIVGVKTPLLQQALYVAEKGLKAVREYIFPS